MTMRYSDMGCLGTGAAKKRQRVAPQSVVLPRNRFAGRWKGETPSSPPGSTASSLRHSIPRLGNELVEHRHACLCAQRAFSLLKGTGFKPVWHTDLEVYVPSRPDNEPLKNGNRATAYRS